MASTKMKTSGAYKAFAACNYALYTLFTLICVFPFYYIFINTISANDAVSRGEILFWPKGIHFQNYVNILKLSRIGEATFISAARIVVGTTLALLGSSFTGYLFSKRQMWAHKFWYRFVIVTMYFSAGLIPAYMNIKLLGLMNTFLVYVLPGMFPVYYMILVKTFVEQIPAALEESAMIDGAGYLRRYWRIIMPLSTPILATVAVYVAVDQWNGFLDTVLYISNYHLHPLQYLLYQYFNQADSVKKLIESGVSVAQAQSAVTATSVRLTITVVITLPIMCVYPFLQKYFIKGIMMGAVKG